VIGLGVYVGPGNVAGLTAFAAALGSPVNYATDYVGYRNGWSEFALPSLQSWLIGPWSRWRAGGSGRRLALGVPMLVQGYAGAFAPGAAGAFDGYFRGLAQALVAAGLGDSVIRLGYEANNPNIGPWQACDNPAGYAQMFRRVAGLFRAASAAFRINWCNASGAPSGRALTGYDSHYPGDAYVDVVSQDVYDVWWGTDATPPDRWTHLVSQRMGLNEHIAFATRHGKPVAFPEWGLYRHGDVYHGGGDDPYFVTRMANWFLNHATQYQSYFDFDWGGGTLDDFPNAKAAYLSAFGGGALAGTS
jgi:hypothetical protein